MSIWEQLNTGVLLQGRYRVIRQIGGGGFGQVFEVDDAGDAKVLKVLCLERFHNPEIKNKARALFQREAEFLSRLNHPGIPRVEPEAYFTWSHGTNEPLNCLVMEKIPGSNLQNWLQARGNQPITTTEACEWLYQLIDILEKLHQQQYFHRDIKLSNIMLRPDGQLVLIDFGAVREVTTTYLRKQQSQETGTVLISPGYTPPEQAEGHAVPQSDFFALGRTFVYLLTGNPPLDFPKDPKTGKLIWRERATQISPPLIDLIDRLMAPFPGQRPQNSQEIFKLLLEIQPQLNSYSRWRSVVETIPGARLLDRKCHTAKNRLCHNRVFQLALIILLLGGGSLWKSSPYIASAFIKQGYAQYNSNHLNAAWFDYRLALLFQPHSGKANYNLGKLYAQQQKLNLARAAYEIAVQQGFDKAYNNLARLYILDRQPNRALSLLNRGLPLAQENSTKYAMLKNLGWAQMELGHYQEAETNLHQAIALSSDRAPAYCLNALLLERQNHKPAALPLWENCLKYSSDSDPDEQRWQSLAPPNLKLKRN